MSDMELLVNDLSIHGQFTDIPSFHTAVTQLMSMRNLCRKFGLELYCHKNMSHAQVTNLLIMPQAIKSFSRSEQSALMQWLTKNGPYWEDCREHDTNDYLECNEQVVTDCAIGEAAFRNFHSGNCHLVSMKPSSWEASLLSVWLRGTEADDLDVQVVNHVDIHNLEETLHLEPSPIESWRQLGNICCTRFTNLNFSSDAFESLTGHPFVPGAAQRIIERLDVLERFKKCFDENNNRTPEGNQLYQDYFTGDKAWFSDSSDDEKRDFKSELTFKHPVKKDEKLFCTMHGKVKTPQIRIHFSWPVTAGSVLYVVYVGHKLTKR